MVGCHNQNSSRETKAQCEVSSFFSYIIFQDCGQVPQGQGVSLRNVAMKESADNNTTSSCSSEKHASHALLPHLGSSKGRQGLSESEDCRSGAKRSRSALPAQNAVRADSSGRHAKHVLHLLRLEKSG